MILHILLLLFYGYLCSDFLHPQILFLPFIRIQYKEADQQGENYPSIINPSESPCLDPVDQVWNPRKKGNK